MSNFNMWNPLGNLDSAFALRSATDSIANPTRLYDPAGNDLCLRYAKYTIGEQADITRFNVMTPLGFKDLNQIFMPKGLTWQAMGEGVAGNVQAISAYDNLNVYVGGAFTNVGGDTNKSRIAKWDGTTWQAMGSGVAATVNAIYAYDNSNVYVGGLFTNIGRNSKASYIARWTNNY
jgi:hypothetical protein